MPPAETTPSRRGLRLLLLVALLLACAFLVHHARTPPAPLAASAPDTAFSAMRAMRHLGVIAERPHPIGSADAARVRTHLVATLDSLGLATDVQEVTAVGTRYQAFGRVRNVVARLQGTQPGGPAVLLMSHYDGEAASPAAADAGSGVAVILEVVRALRAGPPLVHDVIVLFTDGEEEGLLGAAAFVREHRWKGDVAATLNFEARGTGGRVAMFETGPGNLDLVRVLRRAPDVSASSLFVTVYRILSNDTDLSELSQLGKPALNFAFTDGVERYHTAEDDTLHIDPGSLQQEGAQALAIVRELGRGPLPRPVTPDAVFADVAPFGLLYYTEALATPLALVLMVMFVGATVLLRKHNAHWRRDTLVGVLLTILSAAAGGALAAGAGTVMTNVHARVGGNAAYATPYVMAIVAFAVAAALAGWALARRWCTADGLHHGVLLAWSVLAIVLTWQQPGMSFLAAWPLAAALTAALLRGLGPTVAVPSAVFAVYLTLAVLVPPLATAGPVLLGMLGLGGLITGVGVALTSTLLGATFEALLPGRTQRLAAVAAALGAVAMMVGAATVRHSVEHPARSLLVYAADADSGSAWLTAPAGFARPGSWTAVALGPTMKITSQRAAGLPAWFASALPFRGRTALREVPRVPVDGPSVVVLADSTRATARMLVLRITAPSGAMSATVRVTGARVEAAVVDGRPVGTTRFRQQQDDWSFRFAAPPDSGFVLAFTLAAASSPALELTSMIAGLPTMPGVTVPARSAGTVVSEWGDVTVVRRAAQF